MELADLVATGARSEHSEGIIDLLAQSETAEVALLLKEKDNATRVSVRTKPGGVDATALCGTWGGGGHPRAAGASLDLPLADAAAVVLPVAIRFARAVAR
jgi:phosphoesterase RecJ-like protein